MDPEGLGFASILGRSVETAPARLWMSQICDMENHVGAAARTLGPMVTQTLFYVANMSQGAFGSH
jgi:hypothetical protein